MQEILQLETSNLLLRGTTRSLSIEEIHSDDIQKLIIEMREIMHAAPGVGLAATQIGIPLQLTVIEDSAERIKSLTQEVIADRARKAIPFHVIINPKIIELSGKVNLFFEGCLSIKNITRITPRYHHIKVEYLDEHGNQKTISAYGWYARILQHEIDHLSGKLFIDIADPRSEISMDYYVEHWANKMSDEVENYYYANCCGL